jgi:hypothetical protein
MYARMSCTIASTRERPTQEKLEAELESQKVTVQEMHELLKQELANAKESLALLNLIIASKRN